MNSDFSDDYDDKPQNGIPSSTKSNGSNNPSVKIKPGTVIGKLVKSPQGVDIEEYLGIPFAKSPVDDLRFANPEPLPTFPGGKSKKKTS